MRSRLSTDDAKISKLCSSQRDLGVLDASPTYFMGQNIDLFFTTVVAHLTHIPPKSAKRYAQALNWFALRDVHTCGEVPVIGRPAGTEALATQQCCHRAASAANGAIGRGRSDLHNARRTDILSEVQYRTAVLAAVQHTDWKTIYVAWTVCEQTMLRMGSLQVLKFCNLRCNLTHGPTCVNWADGCRDPMLEILLEPELHKTGKNDTLQIVQGYTVTSRIFYVATLPLRSQL
jgi:hypothetical protein